MTNERDDTTSENITSEGFEVGIHWRVPDDLSTLHATNFMIQNSKDEFILMVFEVRPPLILDPESAKKYLAEYHEVEAKCLARISVTPDRMKELLAVMQKQMDRYESQREEGE